MTRQKKEYVFKLYWLYGFIEDLSNDKERKRCLREWRKSEFKTFNFYQERKKLFASLGI